MKPLRQIIVRPAQHKDVESLIGFSMAMARETEQRQLDETKLREGVLAILSDTHRGFFIVAETSAQRECRIIGQLMITYEWSDWRNGVFWWVQSVYVDPAWRGQGVYRSLYDHILNQAKGDPSVCGIRLYVAHDNHTAQHVYHRMGLSPSGYIVYEQDFVFDHHRSITGSETSREAS